ncbi:E3 ubiquitin ligase PQT3-like isoform X2 [Magnolia sinica]|uniref:E3 ubiquitin ligase PQT3-like isoform X2 n=1 Tax=Magnolia sinica TaxID=86752 RepID=UPI0026587D25|nr:E3 ubiquitin ligase PQT3-like isoform X2 [Magnolia sinica]
MAVYYKFKSAKDYDSIPIDGHFISVANLKEKIFESKHLGRGTDFDLMVSNAQTNEEYPDEAMLIPKNTSVLVRRVPGRPRLPIVTERDEPKVVENKVEEDPQRKSSFSVADPSAVRFPEESEWDEFGNDLYAIPEVLPVQSGNPVQQDAPPPNKVDEDSKIKALIDTPALDWPRQNQEAFGPGRGFGRGGMGGRMNMGRGFGRGVGGLERKTPPPGYTCHRCKVPGHFIQHCPTNGDPNYDIKRVKPPTGIPKSMLMATPDGSYALPSGAVAVLKPNEAAFEREIEGLPSTRHVSDLPPELRCPLCKEVMKDAVLTSKCCFKSFCDKCIRDHIISKSICICGATNILADDLLPNKTLRETINRILESTTSSAENAGSVLHVQDMESARCPLPKAPSPTLSATAKEETMPDHREDHTHNIKETVNEGKAAVDVPQPSLERSRATKNVDVSEATLESMSVREPVSQGSAPLAEEEVQQNLPGSDPGKKKKKKKVRIPANAADLQWRTPQDLGGENHAMHFGPSAYNPYWPGMQWGMDGYMAPLPGPMPYMGYTPGPFEVPFGGVLPQDPFGGQGYMMPVVPPQRDLSELGTISSNPLAPVMTREEFEARKADLRRKREMERRSERDCSKDRECSREMSSTAEISSMKSKHRMMSQAASVDRPRREPSLDRPPRDASKRKSDHEEVAADAKAADRRQKGSVFSRISFPDSGASDGNKKRKLSEAPNGLKSHHETTHRPSSNGYREDWKPVKGGSSGGGRRGSLHDHDSSDEDYHFKRKRPPSVSRHEAAEWEEDARPSRGSRERERSAREHEREWEYERERPSKQHRRPKLESDFVD